MNTGLTRRAAIGSALSLPLAATLPRASRADDAALIEAAKKEGSVVWYSTLIVNQLVRPVAVRQHFNDVFPPGGGKIDDDFRAHLEAGDLIEHCGWHLFREFQIHRPEPA